MSGKRSGSKKSNRENGIRANGSSSEVKASDRGFFSLAIFSVLASAIAASYINFPPGDSWTHVWTVNQWLNGKFILSDWASAVAYPQQVLGWLIDSFSGKISFSSLSILTAVVTVTGCLIAAQIPARLFPQYPKLKNWAPLFFVVTLAPPFTLKIGAGFMTDGYYFLFMAASIYLLLGAINDWEKSPNVIWIRQWAGFGGFGILASLQRAHGLVMLFIVAVWLFGNAYKGSKRYWLAFGTTTTAFVLSAIILSLPEMHTARSSEVTKEMGLFWTGHIMSFGALIKDRLFLIFGILEHFGFALLPIALLARLEKSRQEKIEGRKIVNWFYVLSGTAFLVSVLWLIDKGNGFPYLPNSLTKEGFGPRSDTIALAQINVLPLWITVVLTIIGTIGGIVLIWLISRTVKKIKIDWLSSQTLIGLIGLAHLGLVLINLNFFDRYLLPIIPFALCWLAPILADAKPKARSIGWIIAIPFLIWSLWGTCDYLSWTKAKWDIAAELRSSGIAPDRIIGGYEIDSYYNYKNENYPGMNFKAREDMPWWIDKLGLPISPEYVVIEKGADISGTPWENYEPTEFENGKFHVIKNPE